MNFMRKQLTVRNGIIVFIVIIIGFLVYKKFFDQNNKKAASTTVKKGVLEEKLTLSGKVEAEEHMTLKFQTSGKLTWLGVKEGEWVKKYQTIASLDVRDVKKRLDKQLNTFSKTRLDFDQTQEDYENKAITDAIRRIIDKSQFDLNNAVIDVELQHIAVELSYLITPIEGIVVKLNPAYAGVNTTSTQEIAEIVNPETIYFAATADQTEVIKLEEKMGGELVLDAYPEKTFQGTVSYISLIPKTDETGTVYTIKFTFEKNNNNNLYKLGMTGDLTFTVARKENTLYLPINFVKSENGKNYVMVRKNNKPTKRYVTIGMETEEMIEITSGVSEGILVYD